LKEEAEREARVLLSILSRLLRRSYSSAIYHSPAYSGS
jgi:hypothetical protein